MSRLIYYISLPYIYGLSYLPMRLLYIIADILYYILYYLVRYRRTVVRTNLQRALPHKTPAELQRIERDFYSHFCDLLVETLKSFTISNAELNTRCTLQIPPYIYDIAQKNQTLVVLSGHHGNWEWMLMSSALQTPFRIHGIYKPLKNKHFDTLIQSNRSRVGLRMIPMAAVKNFFETLPNQATVIGFLADQWPSKIHLAHQVPFLGLPTYVFSGPSRYAHTHALPVIYLTATKLRRGYYTYHISLITPNAAQLSPHAITTQHVHLLEQSIAHSPHLWLWSHRRWKNIE
jgi:KDO2-lipid IV(A) lauroyltransferase